MGTIRAPFDVQTVLCLRVRIRVHTRVLYAHAGGGEKGFVVRQWHRLGRYAAVFALTRGSRARVSTISAQIAALLTALTGLLLHSALSLNFSLEKFPLPLGMTKSEQQRSPIIGSRPRCLYVVSPHVVGLVGSGGVKGGPRENVQKILFLKIDVPCAA